MIIRINKGNKRSIILNYKGVRDVINVVYDGFQLLRIDILAGRAKDHTFAASPEVQEAFGINHAHIPGAEPAVFSEGCGGSLRILIVAKEYVGALDLDFSRDVVRVLGIYAHLAVCDWLRNPP